MAAGAAGCGGLALIIFILACAGIFSGPNGRVHRRELEPYGSQTQEERTIRHEVQQKESFLNHKLSLDVELQPVGDNLPTESQLTALAKTLHSQYEGDQYERVFICYYLPGMILDRGAWATSHFNPTTEVRILGRDNGVFEDASHENDAR